MKRLIAHNISYRLIAVLCFVLGVVGLNLWQTVTEIPPSRILVKPLFKLNTTEALNPSGYDFGGYVEECSFSDQPKQCDALREKARQFLLKAWNEKRRAYIVVDYFCIDCSPTDSIFVEPDSNGIWHLVIKRHPDVRGYPTAASALEGKIAVNVRRRRATRNDYGHRVGDLLLAFIDKSGEEVGAF